jgi:predicted ester cyclase
MIEAVFDGRQIGEFAGVPAHGAHVRIPYAMSYDVADGVITAVRAYFPMTALRTRLTEAGQPASAMPTT